MVIPKYSRYHRKTIDSLIVALFHAMHTDFINLTQKDFDLMEALTNHDAVQRRLQAKSALEAGDET